MVKKWTEQTIKAEILDTMKGLCIDRMPSRSEIVNTRQSNDLDCAISKYGGYRYFADLIGAEMKESETHFGVVMEDYIAEALQDYGFDDVRTTTTKHPYDILVEKCAKIDVKAARPTSIRGYEAFSFRLAKSMPTCDFYILVCMVDDAPIKIYVVPASEVVGQVQICIGPNSKKYEKYLFRWDLILSFTDNHERMISQVS